MKFKRPKFNLAILQSIDLDKIVEWHDNVYVESETSMVYAFDALKDDENEDAMVAHLDRHIDTRFARFGIVVEGLMFPTKSGMPFEYRRWILTTMTRKQFEAFVE